MTENESKYIQRTYRITKKCVADIREITQRFSDEANIEIAMGKVIELAIHHIKKKPLAELLGKK
jgi:hypothetical protein